MAESVLMDAFGVLSPELKAEVISRHPKNLDDYMKEAQRVNNRNVALSLALSNLGSMGLVKRRPKPPKPNRPNKIYKKKLKKGGKWQI